MITVMNPRDSAHHLHFLPVRQAYNNNLMAFLWHPIWEQPFSEHHLPKTP